MKKTCLFMLVSGCLVIALPAMADGDVAAGKQKSEACTDCHGDDGKGDEDSPSVIGQRATYFVTAMKAYQSGDRNHKKMAKVAKKLNDQDLEDLAAYYATLK